MQRVRSSWVVGLALLLQAGIASAQIDLSGNWALQDHQEFQTHNPGPFIADYLGIPLNDSARAAALSYSADSIQELHRQCQPWPMHYFFMGPFGLRIWSTTNPTSGAIDAWHIGGTIDLMPVTIWMDGREHPGPNARHTFSGFATGKWQADTLIATTTHLKDNYLTRNGVPSSSQETVTMLISRHEDLLTITAIIRDPVYLTEPYIVTRTWRYDPRLSISAAPMHCTPAEEIPELSDGYNIATVLPGEGEQTNQLQETYNIPVDAALGGAETMYPEFRKRIRPRYTIPAEYCGVYCCGANSNNDLGGLISYHRNVLQCKDNL